MLFSVFFFFEKHALFRITAGRTKSPKCNNIASKQAIIRLFRFTRPTHFQGSTLINNYSDMTKCLLFGGSVIVSKSMWTICTCRVWFGNTRATADYYVVTKSALGLKKVTAIVWERRGAIRIKNGAIRENQKSTTIIEWQHDRTNIKHEKLSYFFLIFFFLYFHFEHYECVIFVFNLVQKVKF